MKLYGSMKAAADGLPQVGATVRTLGIRPGVDCPAGTTGPGDGGMSVAPDDPMGLARIRRPAALGGTGSDPVWYIDVDDLVPGLVVRLDSATHALVEPVGPISPAEFQRLLTATRARWVPAAPGG